MAFLSSIMARSKVIKEEPILTTVKLFGWRPFIKKSPSSSTFKTMNAVRKEAIQNSPGFLTTQFLAIEDHPMAVFKPPMLGLFTNVGSESPQGVTWKVDAVFSPNELLVDVLTCAKIVADAQGSVTTQSVYGMPQVLMPASVPFPSE